MDHGDVDVSAGVGVGARCRVSAFGTRQILLPISSSALNISYGLSLGVISWASLPRKASVGRRRRPPWLTLT
jgi:hypothetical protein